MLCYFIGLNSFSLIQSTVLKLFPSVKLLLGIPMLKVHNNEMVVDEKNIPPAVTSSSEHPEGGVNPLLTRGTKTPDASP